MKNSIKINNVKSYDINSGVYIEFSNRLICNNVSIQSNINLTNVYTFGDIILVLDEVNKAYILSDTVLIESFFNFRIGCLKFPFIEYYKKEQPRKYGVYDYSTQKILFETTEWIGRDIFGEYIFSENQGTIVSRGVFSATPLWQFDLGSFGEYVNDWGEKFPYEVEQFIGVLGSNLLVLLNQKELLALDIHTGMIRQRLQYVDSLEGNSVLALDEKNKLKYYNTNYFVQDQNNIVYALFEDVLFEINAAQPTISTTAYGLKNEYDKYQINSYKVSSKTFYYDQKIYFLEQELGRFGILDLPTRSILYVSEPIAISGEGLGFDKLKEIQVAENKVYILDKTNTLHIFEKE